MKKVILSLFVLALTAAVPWACKNPKLDLTYRVLVYVHTDESVSRQLADSVVAYVFYADTAVWQVASYQDAEAGRITSKDGIDSRSYQLKVQRMVPVPAGGEIGSGSGMIAETSQALALGPLREQPVLIVICDVEHKCYAWRQVEIAAGLGEIFSRLYFRPWKSHPSLYMESGWNFVNTIVLASGISLNVSTLTLAIDEEYTLTATLTPDNVADNIVRWTSSDESKVAVVDGKVTAKAVGSAMISAEAGNRIATCEISVIDGVKMNGLIWAKSNVAAPGAFAANPEDAGMFYQWNRKAGWSAIDPMINSNGATAWDVTDPEDTWTQTNDPCPTGWRMPDSNEIQSLLDTGMVESEWSTVNGVTGRKFTNAIHHALFLPASGCRLDSDGTLNGAGSAGHYWSKTRSDDSDAHGLYFSNSQISIDDSNRRYGFAVRCVSE